ncbi:MAG: ABC transporter permease [Anaerolineae bacterium]
MLPRKGLIAALMLILITIAPLLAPQDPYAARPDQQLRTPESAHLFGTDLLGRDVFSRTLFGGQRSIWAALIASIFAMMLGIPLGLAMGIRAYGVIVAAVVNALLALPSLIISLVLLTTFGSGVLPIIAAVGTAQIAGIARLTYTTWRSVSANEYHVAAHALGATPQHILLHYLLPNMLPILIPYAGVVFSYCLLNTAALTFLGFGGDPAVPDWGEMLYEGRAAFRTAPWIGLFPGAAITCTVLFAHWITRPRSLEQS